MDFISDWKFWSFFVAAIALILSQLPHINTWFKKGKLQVSVFPGIFVTHMAGNPNLHMQLILRNTGGKTLRVKSIKATIVRDKKNSIELHADTYVPNPSNNIRTLLTEFDIKPREEWNHYTLCYAEMERTVETDYKEAESVLRDEVDRLLLERLNDNLVTAASEYVEPINAIFEKLFYWKPGDYVVEVSIETDKTSINFSTKYRFTIFEYDTRQLQRHKEGFSSGATLWFESPKHAGVRIKAEPIE